ncbi:hypothetical protein RRG08_065156 [Elysia crispata]|uniref:Uncharacterized protein n=1 Tax=Elysia crispata TaxID=231223 RepID=A0AAE1DGM2_9GAST|nr:hypothetical protein RRG08_065156 [Elysia crispata]
MISVSRLAPVESAENNDFSLPPRSRGVCRRTMISVSTLICGPRRLAPVESAPENNDFILPPRSRGVCTTEQ